MDVDRDTVARLVLAALGVLAVGLASSTLNDTQTNQGSSPGFDGTGSRLIEPANAQSGGLPIEALVWVVAIFFVLALLGILLNPVEFFKEASRVVLALVGIVVVLGTFFWLSDEGNRGGTNIFGNISSGAGVGSGGGSAAGMGASDSLTAVSPDQALLLFGVLGVAFFGALAYVVLSDGETPPPEEPAPEEPRSKASLAGVGVVAGRAADAIETSTDVDNEVYSAWRGMTRHLDVDRPKSTSPGEFRAAAVDAGMAPEHVDALTELFEEVRYGGEPPTAEREARARDVLRRIESAYGTGVTEP